MRRSLKLRRFFMSEIVLLSFNARYEHTSLGARCLFANLKELKNKTKIIECALDCDTADVLEKILNLNPKIIGIGVYIWNAEICKKFLSELKSLRPDIIVVLGGPEISYETEKQSLFFLTDYVITGEGENAFYQFCDDILSGEKINAKIIHGATLDLNSIEMPYSEYSADDISNRLIYVEASRGCPFGCEFCLSSLDKTVRYFPLDDLFYNLKNLLNSGVLAFKFIDRSFNLDVKRAVNILQFFLNNYKEGLFLHFEIVPDKLSDEIFSILARFPLGCVQLEAGIQSFNSAVALRINRRQDNEKIKSNIKRILSETKAYIHADLVAGLPGETIDSFANGFDTLYSLNVHEIQVGILKRLYGAPISRHNETWQMKYSPLPPYEIRQNKNINFNDMRRIRRFSKYWDLISNSGNFIKTSKIICSGQSPFNSFMKLSDILFELTGQTHSISRHALRTFLGDYLIKELNVPGADAAKIIEADSLHAARMAKHKSRQVKKISDNKN